MTYLAAAEMACTTTAVGSRPHSSLQHIRFSRSERSLITTNMEPRMKHQIFLTLGCAAVLFVATGTSSLAQDSQISKSPEVTAKDSPSAPKKHRVWTDDEVSTLRTPADDYVEQKQAADAATAAAAAAAAEQAKSKAKSEKVVAPPRL